MYDNVIDNKDVFAGILKNFLIFNNSYDKFEEYIEDYVNYEEFINNNFKNNKSYIIDIAFSWSDTEEGFRYWLILANTFSKFLKNIKNERH